MKFAPDNELPMLEPPIESVYQLIVPPVALKLVFCPIHILLGDPKTLVGAVGKAFTFKVFIDLLSLIHPFTFTSE